MTSHEPLLLIEYDQWRESKQTLHQKSPTHNSSDAVTPPQTQATSTVPAPVVSRAIVDGILFPAALKAVRLANGLSQRDLASLLDVGETAASRWECGADTPIEQHYAKLVELFPELVSAQKPKARAVAKPGVPLGVSARPISPDCSLSPDQIAALSPKETPAPMANPAQDSFKDGIKFATLLGSLATGRDGARVLEMLQIAKQRGLSIDDVIASMQEAGR
jgi:transcriptional regulator with XRE-family HTH domain